MPRGSLPGERRGGRQSGTPNQATGARAAAIAASGLTPLDYLISVMRDEDAPRAERMQAAVKAAPYVHPRLAAIEDSGPIEVEPEIDLMELTDEERDMLQHLLESMEARREAAALGDDSRLRAGDQDPPGLYIGPR